MIANRSEDPDRLFDQNNIFVIPRGGGTLRQVTAARVTASRTRGRRMES